MQAITTIFATLTTTVLMCH